MMAHASRYTSFMLLPHLVLKAWLTGCIHTHRSQQELPNEVEPTEVTLITSRGHTNQFCDEQILPITSVLLLDSGCRYWRTLEHDRKVGPTLQQPSMSI